MLKRRDNDLAVRALPLSNHASPEIIDRFFNVETAPALGTSASYFSWLGFWPFESIRRRVGFHV